MEPRYEKSKDYDPNSLPDYHEDFISQEDLNAFAAALGAPSNTPVTALNDWKPIHQKIKKSRTRKKARSKDETREGFVYLLLRYPILLGVLGWIVFLFIVYNITQLFTSTAIRWRAIALQTLKPMGVKFDYIGGCLANVFHGYSITYSTADKFKST